MALVINEEQLMLKESAQGFLAEFAPVAELRKQRDAGSETGYASTLWTQMVNMGWASILVPEAYGGLEFGHVGMCQIVEQTGRTLTPSPLFASAILGVSAINLAGTEQQKQTLLGALAAGELTTALAVDETAHHAPQQVTTSAVKQSDGSYQLQGSKTFVADGSTADKLIVTARTSGADGDRHGISLFLVDREASGVDVQRIEMVDSRNYAAIHFNGVTVDADALLGQEGAGYDVLSHTLDIANTHLAAELLGISLETFDRTLQYLKDRKQFGVSIGSFQALQHRAAHWWSEIELSKSLVIKALQALDAVDPKTSELASIAKAKLSEVAELSTNEAIQMHGGIGMTDEYEIGFFIKRARPAQSLFGDYSYHSDRLASINGY
jgi:acyl-CoA dehydrogenase